MKKSIDLLKTKFEQKLKGKVKGIFIGDPVLIPASYLPCLMIGPDRTETNVADNARDLHTHHIVISLIVDARQYFDKTPEQVVGTKFLMETMGSEDSTGSPDTATILGVIRDNLDLDTNRFIQNVSLIDYTTRKRSDELITLEATARIQIEQYTLRER